jgi:hypothetical protein
MQFAHYIIQDTYKLGTYVVEFLRRRKKGWSSSKQICPRVILMDLVYIQKLDEEESAEQ